MKSLELIRNQYIFAIIFISTMANDSIIPFAISVFTFLVLTCLTEKLKSEEIHSWEVGFKGMITDKTIMTADYYISHYH